jgi:lambda repressor-like predicted transcriptional regulator
MQKMNYSKMTRAELIAELKRRDIEYGSIHDAEEEIRKIKEEALALKAEFEHKVSEAYWSQGKNERGAGRKPKLTPDIAETVRNLRAQGKSFRAISKETGLSVGLVHTAANK